MAVNFSQSIDTLLDGVRQAYLDDMTAKGMNASGKTASSLTKEVNQNSGTLFGASNLYQLKHGRKPGKFPPIDDIIDWLRAKNIQPKQTNFQKRLSAKGQAIDQEGEYRTLAFLIARKIAEKGSDIFTGKRPALNVDDKIKVLQEEFLKSITKDFKTEIIETLKKSK